MILLISHDSLESTTEEVENWLYLLNASYIRINGSDLLKMTASDFELSNEILEYVYWLTGDQKIDIGKINAVWYRRWQNYDSFDKITNTGDIFFETEVNQYRLDEFKALSKIFFSLLNKKYFLGASNNLHKLPSKMEQLKAAKSVGIQIPASLITDNKVKLLDFFYKYNQRIISKANSESPWIRISGTYFAAYTSLVDKELIDFLPAKFFPTLFQEFTEKEVELRVFYMDEKCYAMAIFSTLDKQTEIDFRIYNLEKPNRYVPFQLPLYMETRIKDLMNILNLNTGSLDFILTKKKEFVFLEVNPSGQFGMVSLPCNYYLEEMVARKLIEEDLKIA